MKAGTLHGATYHQLAAFLAAVRGEGPVQVTETPEGQGYLAYRNGGLVLRGSERSTVVRDLMKNLST